MRINLRKGNNTLEDFKTIYFIHKKQTNFLVEEKMQYLNCY